MYMTFAGRTELEDIDGKAGGVDEIEAIGGNTGGVDELAEVGVKTGGVDGGVDHLGPSMRLLIPSRASTTSRVPLGMVESSVKARSGDATQSPAVGPTASSRAVS